MNYVIRVKRWNTVGGVTNSIRTVTNEAAVLNAVKYSLSKNDTLISIIIDKKVEENESRSGSTSESSAQT